MSTPAQRLETDRAKYPGMLVDEILIWKGWLALNQTSYDGFQYNVRIGVGQDPGEQFNQTYRDMAIALTKLRLDAVGWQGTLPTIFEVKRNAGPSNVGQLLTYDAVWRKNRLSNANPRLVIVCNIFQPNISQVAIETGITIETVAVNFSVLAPQLPSSSK